MITIVLHETHQKHYRKMHNSSLEFDLRLQAFQRQLDCLFKASYEKFNLKSVHVELEFIFDPEGTFVPTYVKTREI